MNNHESDDTIYAIASPPGRAMRGVVRLSGIDVFSVLERTIVEPVSRVRGVHTVRFRLRTRVNQNQHAELPLLLLTAVAPNSYTGDDTAELHTVGNPTVLGQITATLDHCARERHLHLRRAGPGEFTARAFLQGRLTLTQAEGVAATISARSRAKLDAAAFLRQGQLGVLARKWMAIIAERLALVEAGIDFTDQEDVVPIPAPVLLRQLTDLHTELNRHISRTAGAEPVSALPWVVLVGAPNAGKSSLFNALLGQHRAVVSSQQGTTRDMLTEPVIISAKGRSHPILLVDAAGTEPNSTTLGTIEAMMQQVARTAHDRACLRLLCIPWDSDVDIPDQPPADTIVVRTKCDGAFTENQSTRPAIFTSARTGAGLEQLRQAIIQHINQNVQDDQITVIQPRHEENLITADHYIVAAIDLLKANLQPGILHPELVALELRQALDRLSELIGELTPDDVLGLVFSRFCVGK